MTTENLRKTFTQAQITQLVQDAQTALTGITEGPWKVRSMKGAIPFVEAPEPPERRFGFNIEILGEDDNGYPTRTADVAFVAAAPELVKDMKMALEQLLGERLKTQPKPD